MPFGIAVNGEPRRAHAVVGLVRLRPVALDAVGGDGKAAPGEQAQHLVVQARATQGCLQAGVDFRPVGVRLEQAGVLIAQRELDHAVLPGLKSGSLPALIAEAIGVLNNSGTDRAERIQNIFSLEYDPDWRTNLMQSRG